MKSGAHSPRDEYGNDKKNGGQISKARKEVHGSNPRAGMRNLIPSYRQWGAAASAGSTAQERKCIKGRSAAGGASLKRNGQPQREWVLKSRTCGQWSWRPFRAVLEFKTHSRSPAAVLFKGGCRYGQRGPPRGRIATIRE